MRKRYIAAVSALACLAVAGGIAVADPNDAPPPKPTPAVAATTTVTLPTGDVVEVRGGALLPRPAKGREDVRFLATRGFDGDRVVLPLDKAAAVRDGKTDRRLYNVDALLRNGVTDARDVTSAESLGEPHTSSGSDPAAQATTIDFEFRWLDGGVPAETWPMVVDMDEHATHSLPVTDGTGSIDLAPGEYSMVVNMLERGTGDEPWTSVSTVVDFEVTGEAETIVVDGSKAQPVDVDLDVDATLVKQRLELFTGSGTTPDTQFAHAVNFGATDRFYSIPARQRGDHPGGFTLQTEHADPDGDTYSLVNTVDAGIPDDLGFEVATADLAARETRYGSLGGVDAKVGRSNWGFHPSHVPFMFPYGVPAKQTQERTEYYTAGPEVGWRHSAFLPIDGSDTYDLANIDSGVMAVGTEDMEWFAGPLSVRLGAEHSPYFSTGFERWPSDDKLDMAIAVPMFTGPLPGHATITRGVTGSWSVALDGEQVAAGADSTQFAVQLPDGAAGRFTVAVDASREVPWTPLGTKSSAVWEFDSRPVDERTVVAVSAVRFQAEGVVDGYADGSREQPVTLDFETQPGAEDRDCESLTFEVSYDDGKKWRKVKLDRDGDRATATLKHPKGAQFVSVRFAATDDLGQTVKTSTIRSYGLR